jgi:hypothetical protein
MNYCLFLFLRHFAKIIKELREKTTSRIAVENFFISLLGSGGQRRSAIEITPSSWP